MRELRLYGDPFAGGAASQMLRSLETAATAAGWRCAISLSAAAGDARGRVVELTDGARMWPVRTALAPADLARVREAAARAVAATAPLAVCGDADLLARAGLEHADACLVLGVDACARPASVLERIAAHLDGWPYADPAPALAEAALAPYARLAPPDPQAPVLHVGSADPAAGTDLAVCAAAAAGVPLTVLLPAPDRALERALRALAAGAAAGEAALGFATGPPSAARLAAAGAVLLPWRQPGEPAVLLAALASARPVLVSRFAATAAVLSAPGLCLPLGGRHRGGGFEPDPRAVLAALCAWRARPAEARAYGERARRHVLERHRAAVPAPAARPAAARRPVVVLEAPLLELGSAALLTIETARALARRGHVELRLVPRPPLAHGLAWWRRLAPDLEHHLARRPPEADLWLSSGWPPRADRPPARVFAVRIDAEYGALPLELTPLVTDEADVVVVHSTAVERIVAAAGCPAARIARLPHGVDGEVFCERGPADPHVLAFKKDRPAVLFVGGLIWRKGIDVLLSAWLAESRRPALVVKATGADRAYAGYHLGALVERVRRHGGGEDLLLLDGELDAAGMAAVYRACDLLVHPYRGEGFGMPVLEARACGLPVVVTRGGSTDDFCDGPGCLGIDAPRRWIDLPGAHAHRPWVLEPPVERVRAALRDALARLPELQRDARAAAPGVRARHAWERAAQALETIAQTARAAAVAPQSRLAMAPIPEPS